MARYLALATILVLAVLLAVASIRNRPGAGGGHPLYQTGQGTPGPPQTGGFDRTPLPVTGPAPWALSALPECFRQVSSRAGPPAFARAGFPQAAKLVEAPATLHVADCTLAVAADSVTVRRGENVLVIPPVARLYTDAGGLILDRRDGSSEDVRVYATAKP
jgi:hypothetical protein